jgi:CreA protein
VWTWPAAVGPPAIHFDRDIHEPPFTRFVARPAAIGLLLCLSACGGASEVGAVDTVFKFIGPDQIVDAYDDRGGGRDLLRFARQDRWHQGGLGLKKTEASIACRRTGRSPLRSHR